MQAQERDAATRQRADLRDGCQFVLGCGAIIALLALAYFAIGLLTRAVPRGPNAILFLNAKELQNGIFWFVLFGGAFLFGLLASMKKGNNAVAVCAVIGTLAIASLCLWHTYGNVAAITFEECAIELHFVWPRRAIRVPVTDVVFTRSEESSSTSDEAVLDYQLVVLTRWRDYTSFRDTSSDDVRRAIDRIATSRKGCGRSAAPAR